MEKERKYQHAFVKYTRAGKIVSGSLIVARNYPKDNGVWLEVTESICCEPDCECTGNGIKRAYIRFSQGHVVPGSLLISDMCPPDIGCWKEIPVDICCKEKNCPTTTTTSTTSTTTTSTTSTTTSSTTTTTTEALPFILEFDNISNTPVADPSNVNDWNTFFDLPTYGTPFTSVSVLGNEVKLFGGSNIIVKESLFGDSVYGVNLIEFVDEIGCIIELEYNVFGDDNMGYGCENLTTVNLPNCLTAGSYCFSYCDSLINLNLPILTNAGQGCFVGCTLLTNTDWLNLNTIGYACFFNTGISSLNLPSLTVLTNGMFSGLNNLLSTDDIIAPALTNPTSLPNYLFISCNQLTNINFPTVINVGDQCFQRCLSLTTILLPSCINLGGTVGFDGVFDEILGNTINLTIPASLMTCDSGNPDGDIQYLQANNTVTITTV